MYCYRFNGILFADNLKESVQSRQTYIRELAPGDITGEIRDNAFAVPVKDFCEALNVSYIQDR